MALNQDLTEQLRVRIFEAIFKFAREFDLDPASLELDAGFIAAHMVGKIGVLTAGYKEWLDERRKADEDQKTATASAYVPRR